MTNKNEIIIKFEQSATQTVGSTKRIIGLMKAKWIINIIDSLDLEANPRSSRTGDVTSAIQDSISEPYLFPFKTKGILLGSTKYEELERNRIKLMPVDKTVEGILDGGHNTLAIGLYILEMAMTFNGKELSKEIKTWDDFKESWNDNRDAIENYQEYLRENENNDELDFLIPVEIVLPAFASDYESVTRFKTDLYDICEARNNNVQLHVASKAGHKGHFDTLKRLFDEESKDLSDKIEWKTNDGGEIKVQDIVALTWIPLSLVDPIKDENGKCVESPAPNKLFSSKGSCLVSFERLMSSPDVCMGTTSDFKENEVKNTEVISAFNIAVKLPALYDYIYENLPSCYNQNNGSYGRITAVKKYEKRRNKRTPFYGKSINQMSPDGFIMPLAYGLVALMEQKEDDYGNKTIGWKEGVDPMEFLKKNLGKIVSRYKTIIELCQWDPQKVGKTNGNYDQVRDLYVMGLNNLL